MWLKEDSLMEVMRANQTVSLHFLVSRKWKASKTLTRTSETCFFTVIKMQSNTNLLNVIFSWSQNDIFILHTFNPEAPHSSNCQTSANSKRALKVKTFDSLSQLSKWKIRLFSFTILFVHFCTHFLQFSLICLSISLSLPTSSIIQP